MSRTRIFSAAVAVVLLASPLAAQRVTNTSQAGLTAPVSTVTLSLPAAQTAAPSLASVEANAPVGARVVGTSPLAPAPTPRATSNSPALMLVGGAMLLVGAVIGGNAGTIVMLGGGGLGLVGLWQYLR